MTRERNDGQVIPARRRLLQRTDQSADTYFNRHGNVNWSIIV